MPDTLDTVPPGWVYEEEHDLGFGISDADTILLTQQKHPEEIGSRRTWDLTWENITAAEAATVVGVFEAAKTGDGTTTFTPRGAGSPVTVRFVSNECRFVNARALKRSIQLRVKEVL